MTEAAELRKQGRDALPGALEKYNSAIELWRAAKDKVREGMALGLAGQVSSEMGDRQKALDYLGRAVEASHSAGDPKWEGNSLHAMGLVYSSMADGQKALDCYNRALPLRRAAGDKFGEALTLNNIGRTYTAMARYQEALEALLQTLPIRREVKDAVGEAYTLNAIGSVYYSLGAYNRAIEYYDQAIPIFESTKNQAIEAYTLNDLGFNYWMLGDAQKALDYYGRALSLWRALANHQGEGYTLNNAGMAYAALGDRERALDYYGRALDLDREVRDRRAEAYTLHNTGDVLAELGRDAEAQERYRQALAIKESIEDRDAQAATLAGIARLDRKRGDLMGARQEIESAIDIVESLRVRAGPQSLRAAYFGSKSDYYDFYVDLLMALSKKEPEARWDIEALRASDRARARSLLDSAGPLCDEVGRIAEPVLVDKGRSLRQQLEAASGRLTAVLSGQHTEAQGSAAKKALETALTEYEGARASIESQSPHYAGLINPAPLSAAELRGLVDEDTTLLEYSLGSERSYLWAVTPAAITSFELPGRAVIDAAARRVYESMTARNVKPPGETPDKRRDRIARADNDYKEAARELSELVLGPVADQIRTRRLVLVKDGLLQYVPFGALPVPAGGHRPVGNQGPGQSAVSSEGRTASQRSMADRLMVLDHEIVNPPSALVLATMRRETASRKPAPKTLAVLADPVYQADDPRVPGSGISAPTRGVRASGSDGKVAAGDTGDSIKPPAGLGRLRFSRTEAEGIAALVPSQARLVAVDFAADKAAAGGSALEQYRIVHYATHSFIDTDHPEMSGIALSMVDADGAPRDGYLRLLDIYNLRLRADLVVLSACQTAIGRDIKREGLMSITRGFMYAGAPRVMASLWDVDDKATAELMRIFYHGMLVDGLRPPAALRAAQTALQRQQCCNQPYYWAGFTLQGEWK